MRELGLTPPTVSGELAYIDQERVRAIQGSNSIEGFDANLDDAAAVAVGEEPLDADQETRLALKGYRDAMTYVLQLADDEEFAYSTQVIKALHFMMTSYDLRNRPGRWRAGAVYVRNEETGQIVYEGPEVDQVPAFMQELVDNLNGPCHQRIIQAAIGHLNLVMIHPFRDGNGRMARCLQEAREVLRRRGRAAPAQTRDHRVAGPARRFRPIPKTDCPRVPRADVRASAPIGRGG